ncbi:hypothetical protein B5S28_g1063 [[Candida] boidinii]|nr:hypothetical protein B5S28_g1063 [[Candida] boidinii]OWB62169.1 hypothetical protein B5S29_g3090 [[Candida] boidinii]OWB72538.1 hypothetical protein B5S31_g2253 [[Candida] boidinii]OWB79185.1 hypothetical protein B5S32_g3399 [[Candida] boidinii]
MMNSESYNNNHNNLEINEDTVWNCCPYQRFFARTQGEKVDDNWRLLVELKNDTFKGNNINNSNNNNHHQSNDLTEIIKKIEEFNEKNLHHDNEQHNHEDDDGNDIINFEFSRYRKPQDIPSMCLNNKSYSRDTQNKSRKLPKLQIMIPKS